MNVDISGAEPGDTAYLRMFRDATAGNSADDTFAGAIVLERLEIKTIRYLGA